MEPYLEALKFLTIELNFLLYFGGIYERCNNTESRFFLLKSSDYENRFVGLAKMARFLLLLIFVGLFAVGIADYCAPGWTLFEGNCYR